ncbi:hypothetical protein CEXT_679041 [Caerostris extrusa]|uniref:Uncharacterized protein n=1 Tax=Caerostris extrusa TaxID=172846 RepID=A0AAV4ST32_CAEEX|nr:hypothetical protein CEXT_679041 [Caerostris extrusa]
MRWPTAPHPREGLAPPMRLELMKVPFFISLLCSPGYSSNAHSEMEVANEEVLLHDDGLIWDAFFFLCCVRKNSQ